MTGRILVLGGTGMLGQPVVRCLADRGRVVRVLARDPARARRLFPESVEIVAGSALNREELHWAIEACGAVHINLTQESELIAAGHLLDLMEDHPLERVTYVSATTACEENRWFEMVDVKMRTEELLRRSGAPLAVFCPTWVMETLDNFIQGNRVAVIVGSNPPELHFFASEDFGRMVADSYEDDRALGKRLFIHGPEEIQLADALERYVHACYPELRIMRMKLWQAQWIAKLSRREDLRYITRLIDYFDRVGELGDPSEANALFGAPAITLEQWYRMKAPRGVRLPH